MPKRVLSRVIPLALVLATLTLLLAAPASAQEREITGRVTSEAGEPVAGARVTVVGTPFGALTDGAGRFTVGAPRGPATLRVEIFGYRTTEVEVAAGRSEASVVLPVDYLRLDEVVVTGRATTVARRSAANAVATVSEAELSRVPAQSMEQSLQGKIVGAEIHSNSGSPGGGMQVRLRGVSTINAAAEPLYVVDGVIVSNVAVPNNQEVVTLSNTGSNPSPLQQDQVNRIADINPYDIESIEVLKGASAAAIYGSKASNGVVLITTKRGRPGPPRVRAVQRFGVFDLSNTIGVRVFETMEEAEEVWGDLATEHFQPGRVFNPEEELAGRNDLSTETLLSVSGGDESTTYYVSGTLKDDEGIVQNTGVEKQSVRLNLRHTLSERVQLSVFGTAVHSLARRGIFNNDNALVSAGMALRFVPSFFDLRRRPDGTFPVHPLGPVSNPLQTQALSRNEEDVWRLIGAADLSVDLWRSGAQSLRLLANGGVDWFRQKNDLFFPPELHFEPADGAPGTSLLSDTDNQNVNASANLVHTYEGAGFRATTSAGAQYEERDLNIARVVSRNLIAGQPSIASGTQVQVAQRREQVEDLGFYLQEDLQLLDERLLVSAAIRGEQSSANGDTSKVFFYPKVAAAYRTGAPTPWADEVKLRVAYGESGNQPLFGQKFLSLDATRTIDGEPGLVVNPQAGDPGIEPERTQEIEGGVDLTLFDGRASLELTVFQQNITNLLLERRIAPSLGFETKFFNGGELRVRGVEAGLMVTPVQRPDLVWLTRLNFAADRSKVLELPVPPFEFGGFGSSLGSFKIEQGASATQIVGINGLQEDGTCCKVEKLGDANPDFKVSWLNELAHGDFGLVALWDWQEGGHVINLTRFIADLASNTPDFVPAGQERLSQSSTKAVYVEEADFVKLRELTLSYRVPDELTQRLWSGADELRLSLSGRDLLTFTDYSGHDPEVSNFGNQPISRNVDVGPYPPSRSFWFSIELGF